MTLTCGCDMPIEIYCDWLQDQGWDTDELREYEEVVLPYIRCRNGDGNCGGYGFWVGNGWGAGVGLGLGYGYGYYRIMGDNYRNGYGNGDGNGCGGGDGPSITGDAQ